MIETDVKAAAKASGALRNALLKELRRTNAHLADVKRLAIVGDHKLSSGLAAIEEEIKHLGKEK